MDQVVWREFCDHKNCRLGQWYSVNANKAIGQITAFREIETPHAKVHSSGIAAVLAKQNGNNAEADAKLMEMEQASERVLTLLDRLVN